MVRNEITIGCSPELVFDYVTDLERESEWNPSLRSVRMLTDPPTHAGSRYAVSFAGLGDAVIELLRFERPNLWQSTSSSAKLDVRFAGRVSAVPGGSRVELETDLVPHGLLRLAGPLLEWQMRRSWNHHLALIKRTLESREAGAAGLRASP